MKVDESALKITVRPIIKSLIMMLTDEELGKFLDKQAMEDSAVEQIVQKVKEQHGGE